MKLTNKTMIELFTSLKRLDNDKLELDGKVRWNLAKNIRLTKGAAEDYDQALTGISRQFEDEKTKGSREHIKQVEDLLAIELDLPLLRVSLNDLKLENNKAITSNILAGLYPLIDE